MKKYHKIETLYNFNEETKRFDTSKLRNPVVEELRYNKWLFTEKIDGTNLRIYWDGHKLTYAGRTDKSQFSKQQTEYLDSVINEDLEMLIEQNFGEKEAYLFGELYGGNIQKVGKLYSENYDIMIFDVVVNGIYLLRDDVIGVCSSLGLYTVPRVLWGTIDDALEYVKYNEKSTFSDAPLEGLVGTPELGFLDREGKRIIVKIKKRDSE